MSSPISIKRIFLVDLIPALLYVFGFICNILESAFHLKIIKVFFFVVVVCSSDYLEAESEKGGFLVKRIY